jgi:RecB family exonuclease
MGMQRHFLGGELPALATAADFLLERYVQGQVADLSQVVVVLPIGRAGRRLLEILVEQCDARKLALEPPLIQTIGDVPEQLYRVKKPLANELTQTIVWAEALRATPPRLLASFLPHPPPASAWQQWLELGELVCVQHRALASERLDFAQLLTKADSLPGFDEAPRWQALADVQRRYLAQLDSLEMWDKQTARLYAIEHQECVADRDFVFIAVADMNRTMRAMLDQVADRVTVLIHGPPAWQDRFDAHGCFVPAAWRDVTLPIDDAQVVRVETPADQAYAVAEALAKLGDKYRVDEVTIGVPDANLAPQIKRQLSEFGLSTRFVDETVVAQTGPYLLLDAVRDYLIDERFAPLAALVRHADVYAWLMRDLKTTGDILTALDNVQGARLPLRLAADDPWLTEAYPLVAQLLAHISQWLTPLRGKRRKLANWIEPIEQTLLAPYADREFRRHDPADRVTLAACEILRGALAELAQVPESLSPTATVTETLSLVLEQVASTQIPPPTEDDSLELLGWLELPLDDAPALVITSFNEGVVPSSHSADLFLPNRLRSHLGLNDSDHTYARDAYAVSTLLATRQEVTFIVGRRDTDKNPLAPSRLLFATDRDQIARRALAYFAESETPRPKLLLGGAIAPQAVSQLTVPAPGRVYQPLEYLRVTDFRSYLACPYRFYLRRFLRLTTQTDATEELDGGFFGSLAHEVLEAFGASSEASRLENANQLSEWLSTELNAVAERELGAQRRPVLNLQIEQLRQRLNAFAHWQTERTKEGWQIAFSECKVEATLTFGQQTANVQGRIDRIDFHPDTRQFAVFDYKTGDGGDTPKQTHLQGKEWIDLQLPLYRHLAQTLQGITAPPDVGYILLPKDLSQVGAEMATWEAADWQSADATAESVIAAIASQEFWPPRYDLKYTDEDLAPICQDEVAGRELAQVESGGDA